MAAATASHVGIRHAPPWQWRGMPPASLVAVPLFVLFGPDALEYRLADSGARILITDEANWPKVAEIRDRLPELRAAIVVDGRGVDGTLDSEAARPLANRKSASDLQAARTGRAPARSGPAGPRRGPSRGNTRRRVANRLLFTRTRMANSPRLPPLCGR